MMATTDRDFFDGYLDAWNAHDPAAVARYMAEDAIYEDVALGRVVERLPVRRSVALQRGQRLRE